MGRGPLKGRFWLDSILDGIERCSVGKLLEILRLSRLASHTRGSRSIVFCFSSASLSCSLGTCLWRTHRIFSKQAEAGRGTYALTVRPASKSPLWLKSVFFIKKVPLAGRKSLWCFPRSFMRLFRMLPSPSLNALLIEFLMWSVYTPQSTSQSMPTVLLVLSEEHVAFNLASRGSVICSPPSLTTPSARCMLQVVLMVKLPKLEHGTTEQKEEGTKTQTVLLTWLRSALSQTPPLFG